MTIQIESDLKEILESINKKLDTLSTDVTELKIGQAEVKGNIKRLESEVKGDIKRLESEVKGDIKRLESEVKGDVKKLESDISTIKEDIREVKGSQKAQIWTLIGVLITAVEGFIVAVGRTVFYNP